MDGKEKNEFFSFFSYSTNMQSDRNLAKAIPAIIKILIMVSY
jgi:hypothetical protein